MRPTRGAALATGAALLAPVLLSLTPAGCGRGEHPAPEFAPPRWPEHVASPGPAPTADRPNLILVSLDTLRADHLSAYGDDRDTSPSFDRFAKQSTLFANALSQAPKTAPSHMTLMTGLYPEAHRVENRFAGTEEWSGRLSPDLPTLAEILKASGYRTLARTGGGNVQGDLGFDRGFDSYESPLLDAEQLLRSALADVEALAGRPEPFFVFFHTYALHSPYLPPPAYRDRYADPAYRGAISSDPEALTGGSRDYTDLHRQFWKRVERASPADRHRLVDLYDASIRYVDDQLGRFLDGVERTGAAGRTIVVILSDHGEEFGEHGGFEHDVLWQELLHVPLLIHVPKELRPGWTHRRIPESVGLVDVLPTLLDLLSIPIPDHVQGRSLVPLVETGTPTRPWNFAQYRRGGEVALLADGWKLLRDAEGDHVYDVSADPRERVDTAAAREDVRSLAVEQIARVLAVSRAFWSLAREGSPVDLDDDARARLEALGYVEPEPTGGPAPGDPQDGEPAR